MPRILLYAAGLIILLHGLIHLMGFVAYWPLAPIQDLPYKTALLGGRWNLGAGGMRAYSVLWLAAAAWFLVSVIGLVLQQGWWRASMLGAALLSLAISALDWAVAFRGALIDGLIIAVIIALPWLRTLLPTP